MCTSKHRLVALAAPRNHAKSTAITHSYTLANICMRTRSFILIVSDTERQASHFLGDIKAELLENEDLRKVFGVKGLIKDSEADVIVEFEDGHQARLIAKGSEQKLRGIKWRNKRPDLIVCDDLENDEIVMNEDRRAKFRDWFSSALMPCRSTNGIIRYVGTILHMDAMLQRLMPREYDKTNIYSDLCIKKQFNTPTWYSAIYKAHTDDFTHVLWPDRWSEAKLKEERQHYIEQGQADKYAQEYLNQPIDESKAMFRKSDLLRMDEDEVKSRKIYYVGVDLAFTGTKTSDFTAFVVGGVDEKGMLHIERVVRERMDSVQAVELIIELNKRYDVNYWFFEKGALTNSFLPHLKQRMIEENEYCNIELFNRGVNKEAFASTIQARVRSHRVKFDKSQDWFIAFESELLRFPRGLHDDQVDAFAIIGRGLQRFVDAPTDKELAEEEYLYEMEQSDLHKQGQSAVTGY